MIRALVLLAQIIPALLEAIKLLSAGAAIVFKYINKKIEDSKWSAAKKKAKESKDTSDLEKL